MLFRLICLFLPLITIHADAFSFLQDLLEDGSCSSEELSFKKTQHLLKASGKKALPYSAIVGSIPIFDPSQGKKDLATLSFVAYMVEDKEDRPITFVFPGGPGGSCGAEVLATFGPKRILMPEEGKTLLPPYKIIDNPQSLLPYTDLVFVDPVLTGFSRYSKNANTSDMQALESVEGDLASLAQFIHHYTSYFDRWNSPKYVAGISYGAFRSAGLSEELGKYDLSLHGIILLSCAIDYATIVGEQHHPLPDCLLLPTCAATAWHYGRLWPEKSLEEVVEYARNYTYHTYAPYMLQPNLLHNEEIQETFFSSLADLIGLPVHTVSRYLGRFDESLYSQEFFASERKALGQLDTRYSADLSSIQKKRSEDPSYQDMQGIFCAFNAYLRSDLSIDTPFEIYYAAADHYWNFQTYDSALWPNFVQRIRRTLVRNPDMKVFVGSGYFDCRTPFAATEYCFSHLDLPPSYLGNFQFEYYKAGHGFVFHEPSLEKLKKDLTRFYER